MWKHWRLSIGCRRFLSCPNEAFDAIEHHPAASVRVQSTLLPVDDQCVIHIVVHRRKHLQRFEPGATIDVIAKVEILEMEYR